MKPQIVIIESGELKEAPQKTKPTIVIITGQGVIEKPLALSDRIIKSNDFYWSSNNETVTFVRRDILKDEIDNLLFIKVTIKVTEEIIEECKTIYYKEYFNIKNEIILKLIRKKITPIFLITLLIILSANFYINSNISTKNATLQQELSIKRKKKAKTDQQTQTHTKLLAEIKPQRVKKVSTTVDKIASVVPKHTLLTTLSIDPLIRSPENKRPLQTNRNIVIIKGISPPEELTLMTTQLSQFLTDVKIKKIEGENFEIEASL